MTIDPVVRLLAGDRERLIRDVEGRIADVRPDVREQWQTVLEAAS